MIVRLSFLLPSFVRGYPALYLVEWDRTFDRICFHQLRTVDEQGFWDRVPGHSLGHPEVHVCGGEFIYMEPNVLRPCISNELLVYLGREWGMRVIASGPYFQPCPDPCRWSLQGSPLNEVSE